MKRPIVELLTLTLKAGAEADRMRDEHEAWQILRRKSGYVTHRIYAALDDPLQRLVYSEWESKKAVDGARQYLQGTPLMRRARTALSAAPQRSVVEVVGPVTSTKGLDLPDTAVAVCATGPADSLTSAQEEQRALWEILAKQPGHLTHILFHGFDNPLLVGSLSHWTDAEVVGQALQHVNGLDPAGLPRGATYALYRALRG